MIVVMQSGSSQETDRRSPVIVSKRSTLGPELIAGVDRSVIGIVGTIFPDLKGMLETLPGVDEVVRISKPYKLASRDFRPTDTLIKVGDVTIGGGNVVVMAGPCAVETEEQTISAAKAVKAAGAHLLRGGAFRAAFLTLQLQGTRGRRAEDPGESPGRDRPPHHHRSHE